MLTAADPLTPLAVNTDAWDAVSLSSEVALEACALLASCSEDDECLLSLPLFRTWW